MGEKIQKLREEKHMTLEELGNKVGVGKSTVRKWEKGIIANMKRDKIAKVAQALDVSPAYLMGWEEPLQKHVELFRGIGEIDKACEQVFGKELAATVHGVKIPVLGSVPAGIAIEAIEDIVDEEEIPLDWLNGEQEYFALRVTGDSMFPKYQEGDTIIIRKQDDCESGQDCVVYVNGYDATLKKVIKNMDHIILQPLNPAYEPKIFDYNDEFRPVKIAGVVVELRRKI